jgi:phosphoribosylanthranilate isomerase
MRTRIKVCGITTVEDARMALEAGADMIGLVLTDSPRRVSVDRARAIRAALSPEAQVVGVFASEQPDVVAPIAREVGVNAVQVAGWHEADGAQPFEVWHVLRGPSLPEPPQLPMVPLRTYLLDAHDDEKPGGTGKEADWAWAKRCVEHGRRLIVAGGLHAGNVEPLILDVRPFGVDASSRLESSVGKKDPKKVRAFVDAVRAADHARPKRS